MKKYICPATVVVEVKVQSLLVQFSGTEAAADATVLSRGCDDWDDEEDY